MRDPEPAIRAASSPPEEAPQRDALEPQRQDAQPLNQDPEAPDQEPAALNQEPEALSEVQAVPVPHAVGWSRLRRLLVSISILILSTYVTDRGLVRWISWTAEVAAEMDGAVADLRLHVADPPQERWEDAQAKLVMAWDPSDPRCTEKLQQTQRWIRSQPYQREVQVGWMVLPTAEDSGDAGVSTALAALQSSERLVDWLADAPKDQPITLEMLRKAAATDARAAAIFERQLADTELQLTARSWARMAQGLGLGRCGARMDGWPIGKENEAFDSFTWQVALEETWRQLVAIHGERSLDPTFPQTAALRAAHLDPAMAARWQRWIIKHQRYGNRAAGNGDANR